MVNMGLSRCREQRQGASLTCFGRYSRKAGGATEPRAPSDFHAELVTEIPAVSGGVTHIPLGAHLFSLLGVGDLHL